MGISVGGDHLYVQISKLMAKEIEKRVPGRVDWKLFPGAQLGRNDVIMRGLKTGTHIASMQASWIASVVPAFELFGNRVPTPANFMWHRGMSPYPRGR